MELTKQQKSLIRKRKGLDVLNALKLKIGFAKAAQLIKQYQKELKAERKAILKQNKSLNKWMLKTINKEVKNEKQMPCKA